MILKAGAYRFNDVVELPSNFEGTDFTFYVNAESYDKYGNALIVTDIWLAYGGIEYNADTDPKTVYTSELKWLNQLSREITITLDIEADNISGSWFIASTNYNEVNAKPLAEITYNGETIAQLNAGETCTLKCAGLPMETDIIIKINEVN